MTTSDRIGLMGLIPVVVIDRSEDVLPTANAMIDGGLPIMEITLRTKQGIPAIKTIKATYPEILVGAGTVLSVEQAKEAVEAGAMFIVSPGFNDEVTKWCQDKGILIIPGCVTPTEIEHALSFGINILKFFPASIYNGLAGCKALSGPYRKVKFVPTGGINLANLSDFSDKPYIHAIGGGWLCSPKDMQKKDYANITKTAKASIDILLGFKLAHVGINSKDKEDLLTITNELSEIFDFGITRGSSSNFVGSAFEIVNGEIMKGLGIGEKGHVAIRTNDIDRAVYYLNLRGYTVNASTLKEINGKKIALYLEKQINGFGIHLLQKLEDDDG